MAEHLRHRIEGPRRIDGQRPAGLPCRTKGRMLAPTQKMPLILPIRGAGIRHIMFSVDDIEYVHCPPARRAA
jgi:hypothetical protein